MKTAPQAQIPVEDKNEADKTDHAGSERCRDGRGGLQRNRSGSG